jgi:hypothetical protein
MTGKEEQGMDFGVSHYAPQKWGCRGILQASDPSKMDSLTI